MLRTWMARLAVVALAASAALTYAAPAQAYMACQNWGYTDYYQRIEGCVDPSIGPTGFAMLDTWVRIGSDATSATGCKVTGWLILRNEGQTSTWEGPRETSDCGDLDNPDAYALRKNIYVKYSNWMGVTGAEWARGRVCVDLYYNWSLSSGWQRCYTGPEEHKQ